MKLFQHPSNVCMNYFKHLTFSAEMAFILGIGSIKAIIHAIYPDVYITSTSDTINHISKRLSESGCRKE